MAIGSPQWMYNSGSYQIDNSLRFNASDVPELLWPASAHSGGNRRTFTHSLWAKRGIISSTHQVIFEARDGDSGSSDNIKWENGQLSIIYQDGTLGRLKSTALFRDSSAWYHIVVAVDTTQGTNTNRIKVYVNGVQLTSFTGTNTYMDQNSDTRTSYASSDQQYGNSRHPDNDHGLDGYLAEVNFLDGVVATPSDFGEYDKYGGWIPVKYVGSYGNEGYYLDFKSSGVGTAGTGTVGADRSGNTNHFTSSNIVVSDQMLDTPTNNFATWNPLLYTAGNVVHSEGNLKAHEDSNGSYFGNTSTMFPTSGKWYAEIIFTTLGTVQMGFITANSFIDGNRNLYGSSNNIYLQSAQTAWQGTSVSGGSNSVTAIAKNNVLQLAWDVDNGRAWYGVNGTWQNSSNPATGSNYFNLHSSYAEGTGIYTGLCGCGSSPDSTATVIANFGQDSSFAGAKTAQGNQDGNGIGDFFYTPPTGFLALCTNNLPEPAVIPSEHFSALVYAGNATDDHAITGVGFQPDFVWGKTRTGTYDHFLVDVVRGSTKYLRSNTDDDEATYTNVLKSFDSDGFTLGDAGKMNESNHSHVAWNWKANGSGASNTDGSINTTKTSANVDAGFSIMTYTGTNSTRTIGHGLSKPPEFWVTKPRTDVSDNQWFACHKGFATDYYTDFIHFDNTAPKQDSGARWGDTAPTDSVITIGPASTNVANGEYVCYAWHSVEGHSKVGAYTGNGNAEGTFVHTGFRPAYMLVKRTDATENWWAIDTKRDIINPAYHLLYPDGTNAEYSGGGPGDSSDSPYDITSNGFKNRTANANWNADGGNYIFLAIAETPFKYSNAR